MPNKDAIKDAYKLFVSNGYGDSESDFLVLMNENNEALEDAYKLFVSNGYGDSIEDFSSLMGVNSSSDVDIETVQETTLTPPTEKKKEETDSLVVEENIQTPLDSPSQYTEENITSESYLDKSTFDASDPFSETPLSEEYSKDLIENSFQSSLSSIDKELTSDRAEEGVVSEMNYKFKDYGFNFEEAGPFGDAMIVTSDRLDEDGEPKQLRVPLDAFGIPFTNIEFGAEKRADELKSFLSENKISPENKLEKEVFKETFKLNKIQNDKEFKALNALFNVEVDRFHNDIKSYTAEKIRLDEIYQNSFSGQDVEELDQNPNYKLWQDANERLSMVESNILKRQEVFQQQGPLFKEMVGEYTVMKQKEGDTFGANIGRLAYSLLGGVAGFADFGYEMGSGVVSGLEAVATLAKGDVYEAGKGRFNADEHVEYAVEQLVANKDNFSIDDLNILGEDYVDEIQEIKSIISNPELDALKQKRLESLLESFYPEDLQVLLENISEEDGGSLHDITREVFKQINVKGIDNYEDSEIGDKTVTAREKAKSAFLGDAYNQNPYTGSAGYRARYLEQGMKGIVSKRVREFFGEDESDEAIRKAIKNNGSDISKAAHGVVESIPSFIGFVKTGPKIALKLTKKYGPEIAKKMLKDKRNFNKLTRRVRLFAQTYNGQMEKMAMNPNFDNISKKEQTIVAFPVSIATAVLEEKGFRNIINSKGLINGLVARALGKSTMKTTGKTFRQFVVNDINKIITNKYGRAAAKTFLTLGAAGAAEFETGLMQAIAERGDEYLYNAIKEKRMFNTPETVTEFFENILYQGYLEGLGGLMMGVPSTVSVLATNPNDLDLVSDETFYIFQQMVTDPNYEKMFENDLRRRVLDKDDVLTQKDMDSMMYEFQKLKQLAPSIPSNYTLKQKRIALTLLKEKQNLEAEKEGKAPELVEPINKRIQEINDNLKDITRIAYEEQQSAIEAEESITEYGATEPKTKPDTQQDDDVTEEEKEDVEQMFGKDDKSKQKAEPYSNLFFNRKRKPKRKLNIEQQAVRNKVVNSAVNAAKALGKSIKTKIVLYDSSQEFFKATKKRGRGAYDFNNNTIHIDLNKASETTLAHEAFHAVLFQKLGEENVAAAVSMLTKSIMNAVDKNTLLYKKADYFSKQYKDKGDSLQNEERLAELFALMASQYGDLKVPAQNAVINFIKKIAKTFGLDKFINIGNIITNDDASVIKLLNTLSDKVATGREIFTDDLKILEKSEAYGPEGVAVNVNPNAKPEMREQKAGSIYNLPVSTLDEFAKAHDGNIYVITSDATKLGKDKRTGKMLYGGFGYASIEENNKDGVGFASLNDATAVRNMNKLKKKFPAGTSVGVAIMIQQPDAMYGNQYGAEYFYNSILNLQEKDSESYNLFSKDMASKTVSTMKGPLSKDTQDIILDPKSYTEEDFVEAMKKENFDRRRNYLKTVIPSKENLRTNKNTPEYVKAFLKNGTNTASFNMEYGDKKLLGEKFLKENKGGVIVGGFTYVVPKDTKSLVDKVKDKGFTHPFFQGKVPSKPKTTVVFDGLYPVKTSIQSYMPETTLIDNTKKDIINQRVRQQFTKDSQYQENRIEGKPLEERTYTDLKGENKILFKSTNKNLTKKGRADAVSQIAQSKLPLFEKITEDITVTPMMREQRTGSVYFSNTLKAINNIKDTNPKQPIQWIKILSDVQKNGGVAGVSQELSWIGLEDYLNEWQRENKAKSIPQEIVKQYITDNQIEIVEVSKGTLLEEDMLTEKDIDRLNELEKLDAKYPNGEMDDYIEDSYDEFLILLNRRDNSSFESLEAAKREKTIDAQIAQRKGNRELAEKLFNDSQRLTSRQEALEFSAVGGVSNPTKYSAYTLPNGKRYQELLLTLPKKKKSIYEPVKTNTLPFAPWQLKNKETGKVIINQNYTTEENAKEAAQNRDSFEGTYRSSHWSELNILAHIRMNERVLPNGEKVLFIEEIQSDWAQQGKKQGFETKQDVKLDGSTVIINNEKVGTITKTSFEIWMGKNLMQEMEYDPLIIGRKRRLKERRKIYEKQYEKNPTYIAEDFITGEREVFDSKEMALDSFKKEKGMRTPDMPYKKTDQWIGLAIRRVMKMAADKGLDRIAWVTGEQSAERYDLSKQVDEIQYRKLQGNKYAIVVNKDGQQRSKRELKESELEGFLGKEVAEKIINNEGKEKTIGRDTKIKSLSGLDLKVGGEGMKTFYNSIVPKVSKAEAQRFDKNADIEVIEISQGNAKNSKQLSIPITPEMKEELEGGIGVMREQRMAPNGKPSKLTPKQYDIVRTPAFKRWFGDWQNDPENASKVVDENGEPMVTYHGTSISSKANIEIEGFDSSKSRAGLRGFSFASIKDNTNYYNTGAVLEVFLNLKNPMDFDKNFEIRNKIIKKLVGKDDIREMTTADWLRYNKPISILFEKEALKLGYDGVFEVEQPEAKVFKNTDIKYADGSNTTFDPSKPSIREQREQKNAGKEIVDIITIGRDAFSDKVLKWFLINTRGYNEKLVTRILETDIDLFNTLPKSYSNLKGGALKGINLFKKVKAFESKLVKQNKKKKVKLTEQEIATKTIEFLQAQPAYIREGDSSLIPTTQQAMMEVEIQKNVSTRPTQSLQEKLSEARRVLNMLKRNNKNLQKTKIALRNFIRKSLPLDVYSRPEVRKLIGIINKAEDAVSMEELYEEVAEFVNKKNNKRLEKKIDDILNDDYKKKENKLVKIKSISQGIVTRIQNINKIYQNTKNKIKENPEETADIIDEVMQNLNRKFNEIEKKSVQTEDDISLRTDLVVLINLHNALLMDNNQANKTGSLDVAATILEEMKSFGRSELKEDLEKSAKEYQRQASDLFYDITGTKKDFGDPKTKDEVNLENEKLLNQKRNRGKKVINKFINTITTNLASYFNNQEALQGLMDLISQLPGDLAGGISQTLVTDRVNESSRMYKYRKMKNEDILDLKFTDLYGKNWRDIVRDHGKISKEPTYIIDSNELNEAKRIFEENPNLKNRLRLIKAKSKNEVFLSQNEMIYYYNLYKDPANKETFRNTFGENYKESMEQIESKMEDKVKEFADWQVEEFYPSLYLHYNKTYKALYRTNLPWNEYYSGMIYREGVEHEPLDMLSDKSIKYTSVGSSSTKARTDSNKKLKKMNAMNVMATYLRDMEYFAAYGETIRDINKLFSNKQIQDAIKIVHGDYVNRIINKMITKLANQGIRKSSFAADALLNAMNTLFVLSRIGLNPVVTIKQLTSMITYADNIGYRNWLKYALKTIPEIKKTFKEVSENSVYMKDRDRQSITRVIENYSVDDMVEFVPNKYWDFYVNFIMYTTKFGDKGAIYLGGMPNYLYYKDMALKRGMSEQQAIQEAIRKFERDTKNTQQSQDLQDKDAFQTDNAIARSFNMFMTTPKQYLRQEIIAVRNLYRKAAAWDKNAGKGSLKDNLRTLLTYHVVAPALFQYISLGLPGILRGVRDDDKEDMLRAMAVGNLNGAFIAGDIIATLADELQDKPYAGETIKSIAPLMALERIKTLYDRYENTKNLEKKEANLKKLYLEIATNASLPAIQVDRYLTNLDKIVSGETSGIGEIMLRGFNFSNYVIEGSKQPKGRYIFIPDKTKTTTKTKSKSKYEKEQEKTKKNAAKMNNFLGN